MLVLTRKEGQSIRLGNDVTVTITKCGRGRVTIGIEAPRETSIHRAEIAHQVNRSVDPYPRANSGASLQAASP